MVKTPALPLPLQPPTLQQPQQKQTRARRRRVVHKTRAHYCRVKTIYQKSSFTGVSNNVNTLITLPENDDNDEMFLKFNCKINNMITECKTALNSTVNITDSEVINEKEQLSCGWEKDFSLQIGKQEELLQKLTEELDTFLNNNSQSTKRSVVLKKTVVNKQRAWR
jgi:hypothetical protein